MSKKVVVTGANGYIGAHLIAELQKHSQHFQTIAVDIDDKYIPKGVTFVSMDLLNEARKETLYKECGEPDICVHLAWRDGFQHNALSHIDDLPCHFHFLKNLADHGTTHFAIAGSFREYGSVNGMVDQDAVVIPDNFYTLAKSMLKQALEIYFKEKNICLQWLRPFTVYGNDSRNNSIMSKIIRWEDEGKQSFPFTSGNEEYDYVSVYEVARQIAAVISQREVDGIIDCCTGKPTRLGDKIEGFIRENHFKIRPEYGAFPKREYDSSVIYGDNRKITEIIKKCILF
ncbi:NAD-dependent epimerase/dehydratase [Desulfitobacterium hafniense DCB-2]|uniref:NAD-dependent epimerase/dehydratase n=1 Tax=Desulfitobacterium hafniense (strain DSM 10664 / DCB-2) TaxID=272564 RepID=B8FVR4_DESHD|nr:NAD-dependent epimerase/dehydratase family protein [Desulfitobacterium hafniense]ACL22466.1 NAD-dependent epimerase/dehydratase [Desulfitobacterium hafniense DCB-2]